MAEQTIVVTLDQQQDYQFNVQFGVAPALHTDEPSLWGKALALLRFSCWQPQWATACLTRCYSRCASSSRRLSQSARKSTLRWGRNTEGRVRVLNIHAKLHLGVPASQLEHLDRVLSQFGGLCTVTKASGKAFQSTRRYWTRLAVLKA